MMMRISVALAITFLGVLSLATASESDAAIKRYDLNIPRQTLDTALKDFAAQTGLQIARFSDTIDGSGMVGPLTGQHSAESALKSLLGPQGLTYEVVNDRTIAVINPKDIRSTAPAAGAYTYSSVVAAKDEGSVRVAQNSPGSAEGQEKANFSSSSNAEDDNKLAEVIVSSTASRVNRQGFEAPTPTTVLGPETLASQAKLNVIDYINNIPSMTPYYPGGTTSIASSRPNFRGLGALRVLVLMDGNRVGYTDPLGGVDLNIMPTSLIQSIEVVSGGASAGWGSDAVAGVMNFHLNNTFEGIKGNVQCGESQYGDNQQCGGGLGAGTSFFNDKLHAVLAVDYLSNNGTPNAPDSREWAAKNTAYVANDAYAPGNGQYRYLLTRNACYGTLSSSGLIANTVLKGTTFNSQGQPEPFIYGRNNGAAAPQLMEGGTCEGFYGRYNSAQAAPLNRQSGYTRLTYDITDSTSVYADALFAHTKGSALSGTRSVNTTVSINNAYLPAAIRARMVSAGITSFTLGRFLPELAPDNVASNLALNEAENSVDRYVVGGKGAIVGSWTWDAHVQYGRGEYEFRLNGGYNTAKFNRSVNSEIDPATGLPRCKTNAGQTADPNCVPVNLFGYGSISQNAKNYFGGTATGVGVYEQTAAAVNVQGEPFAVPAGRVSLAGGLETRKEELSVVVDAVQAVSGWSANALGNESGDYTVNEGYLEAVVPILKNLPFASNLDFNAAGRITDYSNSGEVETWKLGLNYTPFESGVLRLRGTLSVDIRAPTLHELYSPRVTIGSGGGLVLDPVFGTQQSTGTQINGGNPDLVPEVARTKVLGFVFAPNFWALDGLTLSADYYDIEIANGITTLTAQEAVDSCFLGVASVCAGVVRDPVTNRLTSVFSQTYNAQGLRNEGVDLDLTYAKTLSDWFADMPGKLTFNALATFANKQTAQVGTTVVNNVGVRTDAQTLRGVPKWSGNVSAEYDVNDWMFHLQMRFISGVMNQYTTDPLLYSDNHIGAYRVLDTTVQHQLNDNLRVYGGVDNLLNKAFPTNAGPTAQTFSAVGFGTGYYDKVGRSFKLGLRLNF